MTIEDIKNTNKIGYIVLALIDNLNSSFKTELQNFDKTIEADIESAYYDKGCSCREKVISYISSNSEKYIKFIIDYVENNQLEELLKVLTYNFPKNKLPSISGKIAKTNILEWADFVKKIENTNYNSFSVVKEGDDLLVFFA